MHKRGACAWAPRFIDYFIVKWYNIVALLAEYFSKEVVDVADSNQENTLESAQRDISNAVKMGANAAKTAKTVGKVAAQAASGNVAGAAVTLLKDPQTLKKILIIALLPIFFIVCLGVFFLYALPTAIFEAVSSYFQSVGEEWEEGVYSAEGGIILAGIFETIKAGGRIIGDAVGGALDFVKGLWDGLTSWFTSDSSSDDGSGARVDDGTETITEDGTEIYVTHEEAAEKETLLSKIESCQKKIEVRADQIKQAIMDQHSAIDQVFRSRFAGTYDVWDGTTINVVYNDVSQAEAIRLLSAFTVIHGASLEDMNLSDFLKWLGYYREFSGSNTEFNLGGDSIGVTAKVKTWCGTFMPQYLQEQMEQDIEAKEREIAENGGDESQMEAARKSIKTSYEQYQGPAADLLLVVDCPNFEDVQPIYRTEIAEDGSIIIHCSVSFSVAIKTRSVDTLSTEIIGFWDKDLEGAMADGQVDDQTDTDDDALEPAA